MNLSVIMFNSSSIITKYQSYILALQADSIEEGILRLY